MNPRSSPYLPHVDGLRGLAVLSVLLYHFGLGLPGGFAGVDVFFVISGYLITGLILKGLEEGRFSLADFWERRVRRIFPPLAMVVLTSLVLGWLILLPAPLFALAKSAFAQVFLASNFYFWKASGYFDYGADQKPLLHTWSLAVEEQFYLLFPLLLVAARRLSPVARTKSIVALLVASFSLAVYCNFQRPLLGFYLLPPRAWELLLGALLASAPAGHPLPKRLAETLSWGGLAAIIYPCFLYDRKMLFPGVGALPSCVGTALVIWSNGRALTRPGRWLSWQPLVFVGLISYSLYLWHWPVLVFFNQMSGAARGSVPVRLALALTSVALATLSWKFVEAPFRQRTFCKTRKEVFLFAASISTVLLFLANLLINRWEYIVQSPWVSRRAVQVANESQADRAYITYMSGRLGLNDALAENFIEIGKEDRNAPVEVLVWGDSHAVAATHILKVLCKEYGVRGVAAVHAGTAPMIGFQTENLGRDCLPYNLAVAEFIKRRHVSNVILIARWSAYIGMTSPERIHSDLSNTMKILETTATKIWIMRQVPVPKVYVPQALYSAINEGKAPEEIDLPLAEYQAQFKQQNPCFTGLQEKYPNVRILDPSEFFVLRDRRTCRMSAGGIALFSDETHLSSAGALMLRPMFEPIFAEISKSRADGHLTQSHSAEH